MVVGAVGSIVVDVDDVAFGGTVAPGTEPVDGRVVGVFKVVGVGVVGVGALDPGGVVGVPGSSACTDTALIIMMTTAITIATSTLMARRFS